MKRRATHSSLLRKPARVLGTGTFGTVFITPSSSLEAIKAIRMHQDGTGGIPVEVWREILIMQRLRHPLIVQLRSVKLGATHIFLHLECLSFPLRCLLSRGAITVRKRMSFLRDILTGVEYCHSMQIIHRDIKPENLLFGREGLKLSDFGLSRTALLSETMKPESLSYTPGMVTIWYRAPEVLKGEAYSCLVDVWSVGCVAYEMANGNILFPLASELEMLKEVSQFLTSSFQKETMKTGDTKEEDALRGMLRAEKERKSARDLLVMINT